MENKHDVKIVLENGTEFTGFSFGAKCERVNELVFDTSMVGYQEIISDPTYTNQMVVMTYPLIGNYGITDDDFETKNPTIGGLIVREYNDMPSNFRSTKTLGEELEENGIPGIYGLDTRKLTRIIRDNGTVKVLICDIDKPLDEALEIINKTEIPKDSVASVSCKKRWYSRTSNHKYNVVVIDCGVRYSFIKNLKKCGCNVTVVPYDTTAEEIDFMKPDGIFISNGPGNPEDVKEVVETVKALKGKYPMFGACLGNEILCLAYGGKTYKLKFGHRGGNHPVKDVKTEAIQIVSHNQGYAVDEESLENTELEVTHVNVLDKTVEGVECEKDNVFGVEFIPDSSVGNDNDSYFFDKFASMMKGGC